ncbi:MAG: PEGA domain-containing protein [Smithellaceae bacterium]|nr:PEGA domain-containing protein [Smithellaceae bacterium]
MNNETFINRAWLARQLSSINAKSMVIILDSCYSGTKDFGDLFIENLGYEIRSFGITGASRGVAVVQKRQGSLLAGRRIAYIASSREDQPSAEYSELRHGALSYCIFENIKRAQREVYDNERARVSVSGIYANITKLFREVKIQGRSLDAIHQPLLLPIPDYDAVEDMEFLSIQGVKRRELQKGILEIRTDPVGAEVAVDGVSRKELTNCSIELSEGKHHIELFLPATGYRYSFTVDIKPSQAVARNIDLYGVLEVQSFWQEKGRKTPGPMLDVLLNGIPVGKSGLRLNNVLAGTHLLEVRYENAKKQRQIEIRPDSPLHVNYSVIREEAPKLKKDDKGVGNVVF